MKLYEGMFILRANLSADKLAEDLQRVKGIFEKHGGSIESENRWGNRAFSYPIRNKREGFYIIWNIKLDPLKLSTVDRELRLLQEEIMRFIVIIAPPKIEKKEKVVKKTEVAV